MKMSGEMQERYEACRLRMAENQRRFKLYLKIQAVISCILFFLTMYAGASSTLHEDVSGPAKFYYAMDAGVIQALMGIGSLILGFLTAGKKRIPSFILLVGYLLLLIYTLVGNHIQLVLGNAVLLSGGLALNLWIQGAFGDLEDLKTQPGYPHFSVFMEENSEYEAPIYVTNRQSAGQMETVGGAQTAQKSAARTAQMPLGSGLTAEEAFSDMTVPERRSRNAEASLPKPEVALESFTQSAQHTAQESEAQKQEQLERQRSLEAAMLADMTPETAHHDSAGDVSMLPTAEEVRARMAAMKKARENGSI